MNGAKSLSDDLHEEVGGDFRVQGDGCREVTGGFDRLNGDVLRVDLNLGGERDGDLLCGDAAEQLAGLGDLGSDFDGGTLDDFLGGNSLFAGGDGLGQTSALHGLDLGGGTLGPDRGKIRSRRITGVTVQEQREISKAIKNAREMALLPYATSGR